MAHITGKLGQVYATTTGTTSVTVLGMKSWTLDYVGDALETTDFGDAGVRSYIAGLTGWSGSFEGYKDGAPWGLGTLSRLELRESATTTQFWIGIALVTGIHESVSFDGIVSVSYDFQGTGALTPASA